MARDKSIPEDIKKHILNEYFVAIQTFFNTSGGFKLSKKNLKMLFYAAFSEDLVIKKESIPALHLMQKDLIALLSATYQAFINGSIEMIPEPDEAFINGLPRQELYCGLILEDVVSAWNYYPRHLNKEEFVNPSIFFGKFFEYKKVIEWKTVFEELFYAALVHESVIGFSDAIDNVIQMYDYSFKFLEISHIIKVRHDYQLPQRP